MKPKTPFSFLPFLVLAVILCLAAVLAAYFRLSLQPTPAAPVVETTPTDSPATSFPTIRVTVSPAGLSRSGLLASAYPAFVTPTLTFTPARPAEHGYPAPGLLPATRAAAPKEVTTEEAGNTPTHLIFLPMIGNGKPTFDLQATGIIATQGFSGCNWTGVAGQVFDLAGNPLSNLIIHLQGTWSGASVSQDAITGGATEYGPAGYVFVLGTQPLDTSNALKVQLLDANRKMLSLPISLSTYSDCAHNLILVNFTQNY